MPGATGVYVSGVVAFHVEVVWVGVNLRRDPLRGRLEKANAGIVSGAVSYTHLRAHETSAHL
eukprot:1753463-Alexandrium_andersonii.AAC.1